MITKIFDPTIERIKSMISTSTFRLEVDNALLNGYDVEVQKAKEGFAVKIDFKPYKGFTTAQLAAIKLSPPIRLHNDHFQFYLPENCLLFNQYQPDFNNNEPIIVVLGSISQLVTAKEESVFNNKFLRLLVPIGDEKAKIQEIQGYNFNTDIPVKHRHLVKVAIGQSEYHFYRFGIDSAMYLGVDTTTPSSVESFRTVSHNILTGLGFLFGDLFMDEGYLFSSPTADFTAIENAHYSTYRESLLTGITIYTTNPFSIYNVTGESREEIESRLEWIKSRYKDIPEITPECFSTLCELLHDSEPISRAAIIVLQGNQFALEMKGSAYSAALEAITTVILKENGLKYPKPIDNKELFDSLRLKIFSALDDLLPAADETNGTARKILTDRINNLNYPTNAIKLQTSFKVFDYPLKQYEIDAIKARDKFQHGELPVDEITDDAVFREVYYICLILHRLIYVLILKRIKFDGCIINYPQLHSHITKKDLGEDLLYKI